MQVTQTEIDGVLKLVPRRFGDDRGFFSEVFNAQAWAELGLDVDFMQDNHAFNHAKGTLRGLHFQSPPFAQAKLVRCVQGAILDVAVDLRPHSPSYGKHVKAILSEENWEQLFIPEGFAHGYMTLTDGASVVYKVNRPYAPDHQAGILWNDPDLKIDWDMPADRNVIIADKDRTLPRLRDLQSPIR
jgi:dTDP-4-dehydrorhamnose 3,5-epimerase